jgi:polyhydroxyalkanoate synthase subunit PhaE
MCFASHTWRKLMATDPWRQWQAFIASQAQPAASAVPGFAPFIDAAERFAAAAKAYAASASSGSAPAAAAAASTFADFLREQFATAPMSWSTGSGATGASMPGGPGAALFTDAPALGAMREHQQRMQRMADAWRRIEDAQRRLQRLWADALREAATAFMAQLKAPGAAPGAEDLRRLYDTWINCAEDAYSRTAHTEVFCNTLAEYVNAGSDWRRELQAGMEHWAKLIDLPTRSEINTLAQRLKSVEEELRASRRPPGGAAAPRRARPAGAGKSRGPVKSAGPGKPAGPGKRRKAKP